MREVGNWAKYAMKWRRVERLIYVKFLVIFVVLQGLFCRVVFGALQNLL